MRRALSWLQASVCPSGSGCIPMLDRLLDMLAGFVRVPGGVLDTCDFLSEVVVLDGLAYPTVAESTVGNLCNPAREFRRSRWQAQDSALSLRCVLKRSRPLKS